MLELLQGVDNAASVRCFLEIEFLRFEVALVALAERTQYQK